jgi:hypothetical protein
LDSRMSPVPIHFEYRFPTVPNKEETAIDAMLALKSQPPHYPPSTVRQFAVWDHYGRMANYFHFHPRLVQGRYHALPHAV